MFRRSRIHNDKMALWVRSVWRAATRLSIGIKPPQQTDFDKQVTKMIHKCGRLLRPMTFIVIPQWRYTPGPAMWRSSANLIAFRPQLDKPIRGLLKTRQSLGEKEICEFETSFKNLFQAWDVKVTGWAEAKADVEILLVGALNGMIPYVRFECP